MNNHIMFKSRKIFLALVLGIFIFLFGFYTGKTTKCDEVFSVFESKKINPSVEHKKYISDQLTSALRHMARGHKFIRSGKAAEQLIEAHKIISSLIPELQAQQLLRVDNESVVELDVCPEKWMGTTYGYPYYYTGFVIENCTWAPAFSTVITILIDTIHNTNVLDLAHIIQGINEAYPGIVIEIAADKNVSNNFCSKYPNCHVTAINSGVPEGEIWRKLIANVRTKYAFVGRNLAHFLPDARLERLVRLLSYINADVVGGAYRNATGHFSTGCYQTSMRNYAYKLVEGYELSYNSCIFCDYIGGPFAVKPSVGLKMMRGELSGDILFVDFFTQIRKSIENAKALVCPDSLFFTQRSLNISQTTKTDWLPLAKLWELNRIILPTGEHFRYNCEESGVQCKWLKGIAMPLCCLEELGESLKWLMSVCDENHVECELEGGSTIGGLKFEGILPWERDGDINFVSRNHENLSSATSFFKSKGLSLKEDSGKIVLKRDCMSPPNYTTFNDINCGYFGLRSKNFRLELWGVRYLANAYLELRGVKNPTKMLVNGVWMNSYPNPALSSRNQYGDDLFEHVEHWITLGYKTGWVPYKTGSFLKCPRPNFHGCLDQFFPVGNLQFLDTYI